MKTLHVLYNAAPLIYIYYFGNASVSNLTNTLLAEYIIYNQKNYSLKNVTPSFNMEFHANN